MRAPGRFWKRRGPPRPATPDWPYDGAWTADARPCQDFHLDAGYGVSSSVQSWMMPIGGPDSSPIRLPDLPLVQGTVLTADAVGREDELIRHFAQMPPLPERAMRRETAAWCSLEVNVLLCLPGEHAVVADTFASSWRAASELLATLAAPDTPPGTEAYDNLDQGWALRILVEHDAVLVLDWNWDAPDGGRAEARALRLPRNAVAAQAAAAGHRLHHLHPALVAALGRDLWFYPARD